jgi:ABC-2 type transport system ATP-binding protein
VSDPDGRRDEPALVCTDLVVRYGDLIAVDHLSFEAHPGEVVALLGPNGAGKTSTVEALEGYRPVAGGSASVLGLDPFRQHAALVPRIGVMLQRGGVYPMLSAAQVLHLFAAYYRDPADPEELLDLVGLEPVRNTRWRRLSGGEQQRLSLALALVGRPEVLFLDEPTAGVDPEGRITIREIVAEQRARGICIVLTTHELTEAERLADRVLIIDHGRLLAEGTPAALASSASGSAIRFSSGPGIDTDSLGSALGVGIEVVEEHPGAYRIELPPDAATPPVVASLTAWLAERSMPIGELRTGASLEEAYLTITASARTEAPAGEAPAGETSSVDGPPADRSGTR